jgi:hypothetical protein
MSANARNGAPDEPPLPLPWSAACLSNTTD